MISVDTNYTNLRSAEAGVEWRIVNGSNTFTVANLISGKISAGLMENVSIGNCISAELDLELWGVTVDSSNPLVVQFRADGGTTWYTKGTFYIDTLEKSPYTENTSVKAFDAMLKAEVGYMASGVWANPTDNTVVGNIASDLGITIESATASALSTNPITLTNAPHIGANGTTDREMLSYIAMLRGGNWKINSANELQLVYPSTTPTDIAQVDLAVRNFAASETLTVSKVKVIVDSETYYLAPSNITEDAWKALAGYCIEITLPFYGTQAVANSLYTQYNGKSFVPYQAEGAYVDPKYEVGDGIRFQKDSTYYTSIIANQDIDISWLCPSDLELKGEKKLESLYPYLTPRERQTLYQFGELENAVDSAQSAASAAQASANGANYREQIIYISKVSGTNSVSANTTWVTNATGNQNVWTTTRPVYSSSYPVLFVATQRQNMSQSSGTTCTCTTPVKDQTTTVIDGGHITTGTIDAAVVNVTNLDADNIIAGTISDASGKNYWNLDTGQFVTKQGEIADFTIYQDRLEGGTYGFNSVGTRIRQGQFASTYLMPYHVNGQTQLFTHFSNLDPDIEFYITDPSRTDYPLLLTELAGRIVPNYNATIGFRELQLYGGNVEMIDLRNTANPYVYFAKRITIGASTNMLDNTLFGSLQIRKDTGTEGTLLSGKGAAFGKSAITDNLVDSAWDIRSAGQVWSEKATGDGQSAAILAKCQNNAAIAAYNVDNGHYIELCNGASGNRGLYTDTYGWLVYVGTDGNLHFGRPVDTTNIPDASASQRGLVNTGTQTFAGEKKFLERPTVSGSIRYPGINYVSTNGSSFSNRVGLEYIDTGSATYGQMGNACWSVEIFGNDGNGGVSSYRERYLLPFVTVGRTNNANYNILTSKNAVTVAQGGTGATTAAAARSNLGLGSTANLLSGALTTTEVTLSGAAGYTALSIIGQPSGGAYSSITLPMSTISTTAYTWQLADNTNYETFSIRKSGSDVMIKKVASSGSAVINEIRGII